MSTHFRTSLPILCLSGALSLMLCHCETVSTARTSPNPVVGSARPLPRAALMPTAKALTDKAKPEQLYLEQSEAPVTSAQARRDPATDPELPKSGPNLQELGSDPGQSRKAYAIAVLGDSLSDPKVNGGGYLEYLRAHCPETQIENFAKGGFMVNQMRRRFEKDVLTWPTPFSHLIVFGGVNDMYSDLTAGRTPPKIEADLSRIYAAAVERQMKVIAITVAPWGGFKKYFTPTRAEATRTVNAWITSQVASGVVAASVDAYSLLSCGNAEFLCPEYMPPFKDGIHFGRKGHEQLGKALVEQVFKDCK